MFVLSLSTHSLLYRSEMIYLFEYCLSIFYKRVLKRPLDSLSDSVLLFRHVLSHPVLGAAVVQVLKRSTVLSDTSAVFQKPSPKTQRDSTWGKIQTTWANRSAEAVLVDSSPWGWKMKTLNRKLRGMRSGEFVRSVLADQEMIIILSHCLQSRAQQEVFNLFAKPFNYFSYAPPTPPLKINKKNIKCSLLVVYQRSTIWPWIHQWVSPATRMAGPALSTIG